MYLDFVRPPRVSIGDAASPFIITVMLYNFRVSLLRLTMHACNCLCDDDTQEPSVQLPLPFGLVG